MAGSEIARGVAGAAASARIDVPSAIFAAWAHDDLEVRRFRDLVLRGGPLAWDEAGPWIPEQRAAATPDGVDPAATCWQPSHGPVPADRGRPLHCGTRPAVNCGTRPAVRSARYRWTVG